MKEFIVADWKDDPETVFKGVKVALKKFGLNVYDLPSLEDSDAAGIVISKEKMTQKEIRAYEVEQGLREEEE
jgi:hypothetical protein